MSKNNLFLNSFKTIFVIFLILFINKSVKTQDTFGIYPETVALIDEIFPNVPVVGTNEFLFEIGYPDVLSNPRYIHKQGVRVADNPNFREAFGGAASYLNTNAVVLPLAQAAGSELDLINDHTVSTNHPSGYVTFRFNYRHSGNTNYVYTCKYRMYNTAGAGDIVFLGYDGAAFTIDLTNGNSYNVGSNVLYNLEFTVTQDATQAKVTFQGNNNLVDFVNTPVPFEYLEFVVGVATGTPNSLFMGLYWVTLNTGATVMFTRDGQATCVVGADDCLENYVCVGTNCQPCHDSCLTCTKSKFDGAGLSSCLTCESHTVEYLTAPVGGICNIEYIDLNQFENVDIVLEPPRTGRVTLGMWTYIEDVGAMNTANGVVHVALTDFMVMSFVANGGIDVSCNYNEKETPTLKNQTTPAGVTTLLAVSNTTLNSNVDLTIINQRWFYSRCAMSIWGDEVYLMTKTGTKETIGSQALNYGRIWGGGTPVNTNIHFRVIHRDGDKVNLQINGAKNVDTQYYIKNLYIFKEFMPADAHFQYWNLQSEFAASTTNIPYILAIIAFDDFIVSSSEVIYFEYSALTRTESKYTLTAKNTATTNLLPPDRFNRLITHSTMNEVYDTTNDLENTSLLTLAAFQLYVFDTNLAYVCDTNYYLNLLPVPSALRFSCVFDCPINGAVEYTIYPMLSDQTGYCSNICDPSFVCPRTNALLQSLEASFNCLAGNVAAFYECILDPSTVPYSLYFSSYYFSENLIFDPYPLAPPTVLMHSHCVEIWWMKDNRTNRNNFSLAPAPGYKNYVFYMNSMRLYNKGNNDNYFVETPYTVGDGSNVTAVIHNQEWNRLIFNVRYEVDKTTTMVVGTYHFEFYSRHNSNFTYVGNTLVDNNYLSKIYFCHLHPGSCDGLELYWYSGYYRNLRIWDGDLVQPMVLFQYNQYWDLENYRSLAIRYHYSFDIKYTKDNIFVDRFEPTNDIDYSFAAKSTSIPWNFNNVSIFNYNNTHDYIAHNNSGGNYISASTAPQNLVETPCGGNCERCYAGGNGSCFECKTNHFITESTCRNNGAGEFYLSMPLIGFVDNSATDYGIEFNAFITASEGKTITFWVKVFGFFKTPGDLIFYGTNLKLIYNSVDIETNNDYGLTLFKTTGVTLAAIEDFRMSFGQWRFFSLAYYESAANNFFAPRMLKFEMNTTSYPILDMNQINLLFINNFKISEDFQGLIKGIKYYETYIIGAYGIETNSFHTVPTYFNLFLSPGSGVSDCYNAANFVSPPNGTPTCKVDYDRYFDNTLLCSADDQFYLQVGTPCVVNNCPNKGATWLGTDACSGRCSGNTLNAKDFIETCWCAYDSSDFDFMIFRNDDKNICYRYDYVNFARSTPTTLALTVTAKDTEKYTMQFWIWAFNYDYSLDNNNWDGIIFEWDYHNKIEITRTGTTYNYYCSPFYQSGSPGFETSVKGTLAFNMQQWEFISCAVDAKTNNDYYMLTENLTFNAPFAVAKPALTTKSTTTLVITDKSPNNEWGVLFLRQIRLWNEQYRSSGFLSRVDIQTPALFGSLLNIWDPIYSGINQMVDVTGNMGTPITPISYYLMPTAGGANRIGMNVVDDTFYSLLFLCSEEDQFYDASTNSCVNFVNLVSLNEIIFPNIPVSYKGNYTLEFWLFNEDFNDITNGVNIIYENHVSIAVLKTSSNTLGASCFPQGYYNDIDGKVGTLIDTEFSTALNAHRIDLTTTTGEWSWVRCAVSNYNKHFYMNDSVMQPIVAETLYDSTLNAYPFRYFHFSDKFVDVKVQGINSHTKKIYIRYIWVFNDFIMQDYRFDYMNLSLMEVDTMVNLLLACDFSNYNLATEALNYTLFEYGNPVAYNSVINTEVVPGTPYALAANFVALPLCNPLINQKYDAANNICVDITSCVKPVLNCNYCYEENKPLQCLVNNYYQAPDNLTHICGTDCPLGIVRSPGQVNNNAICNYDCIDTLNCPRASFAQLSDYPNNFLCKTSYTRVNYQCVLTTDIEHSAIFYSNCYNTPNVFHSFSTSTSLKITAGHILEFWFKIDNVHNSCNDGKTVGKEYYFYTKPHSLYKDYADSQYYYQQSVQPANVGPLPSIQQYEWNIIIVRVNDLNLISQGIEVYVNYNFITPEYKKDNVAIADNLDLASWSFCSDSTEGKCDTIDPVTWGSAYYRNVRVWNVANSTVQLAQAYAGRLFTETLKSLINHYPLTLDLTDLNSFTNLVGNYDHYAYAAQYSPVPDIQYNNDEDVLYNWSTTFDWGAYNIGKYISSMAGTVINFGTCSTSCERCYAPNTATSCYQCAPGFVNVNQECINVTGYYFKTPVQTPGSPVSLKIAEPPAYDITQEIAVTITFWMKFFGIEQTSVNSVPKIMSINANTFLGFDITTNDLVFNQNNANVFTDTNFTNYIAIWVPITLANYKANSISYYYPNMLTLMVNRLDIPVTTGYTLPSSGITISEVTLGFEAVALFAEFRFYSHFIHGSYGQIMSTLTNRPINMITSISLTGTSTTNCISNENLAGSTVTALGIECVGDYQIYLDATIQCDDNEKYFDPALIAVLPPCGACDNICNTLCFFPSEKQCTCDMTVGQFWLRRTIGVLDAYCDKITNIDFSSYDPIDIPNLGGTITEELTLEVWAYVYVYNPNNVVFSSMDIIWDMHTRINLYNKSNSLNIKCFSMADLSDLTNYTEGIDLVITYYKWNLIRCGVDRRNKEYFLNSIKKTLDTVDLPALPTTTSLRIGMLEPNSFTNFGFVFLREIKLWQQYNFKFVNTGFVGIDFNLYPGLLHLFPNDINNSTLYEETNFNQLALDRRVDFIGYNFVDPTNLGLYNDLTLCSEGNVYDETKLTCVTPVTTKCNHPGDTNDNCITCQNSKIFLNPEDGECVPECPPRSFGHLNMNQCRPCHETCYTCDGFTNVTCISCTGDLYLHPGLRACIPNCEFYALTTSLTIPNLCVLFDAVAVLVNVDEVTLINPTVFNYIEAAVTESTADGWTVQWHLNFTETERINNGTVTLDPAGPFSENPPSNQLNAGLNPSFFEGGKKYNFILDIIKTNGDYSVSVSKNWTVIMNSPPFGGELRVTPDAGYRITTKFLMTCDGWITNIPYPLSYRFYAREINTETDVIITDWMNITYTNNNFTVRYFQVEFSTIQVTCEVRDGFDMIARSDYNITIVNTPESPLFNLTLAMANYTNKDNMDQLEIKQRSEFLYSLGVDIYKDVQPALLRTTIVNALDFSRWEVLEPTCINNFCNFRGDCYTEIDIHMVCNCGLGYLGNRCQADKDGYPAVAAAYQDLFNSVLFSISDSITQEMLCSVQNLFVGAGEFIQDPSYLTTNYNTWISLVRSNYKESILNNKTAYFDMVNAMFTHSMDRCNQFKLQNKNSTNYPLRNVSLLADQKVDCQEASRKNREELESLINFITSQLGTNSEDIRYESANFRLSSTLITPTFNATEYFLDNIAAYASWSDFMDCINEIMIQRLNRISYSIWFVFIEYKDFPLNYDLAFYQDSVVSYTTLYFTDAVTNKPIIVEGCDVMPIKMYLPFTSIEWVDMVNQQKDLYNPENYRGPDHPIFKSPIYINKTGFVSNDTIKERIERFQRKYNFTCNFLEVGSGTFSEMGVTYADLDIRNYIVCNTTHATDFNARIIDNDVEYNVDGPFFYLKFPQVFTYWPNYSQNYAFFVAIGLIAYYVGMIIITTLWDWNSYRKEVLLEFLKFNIVKIQMPYNQKITWNPNEQFPINDFIGFDGEGGGTNLNAPGGFGDEGPVDIAFRPRIGGKELGEETINNRYKGRKNGNGPYGMDFGLDDDNNNKGKSLALYDDDVFNLDDDAALDNINEKGFTTNNPFISENDRGGQSDGGNQKLGFGDVNVHHLERRDNDLEEEQEDEEKEVEQRLNAFASLSLSTCEFYCWNLKQRHVVISPIINPSLFNPRYLKFTCFITQCSIQMLLISVFTTADQSLLISLDTTPIIINNANKCILFALGAASISNLWMYIMVWFFRMSNDQRRLLFKVVKKGIQMRILRTWGEVEKKNVVFKVMGMVIKIALTLGGFYFSFNHVSVWTAWDMTWLITFGVSLFIDLVAMECGFEFFIAFLYFFRQDSPFAK